MRVASLRERLLAVLVDAAVAIVGVAVVFGVLIGAAVAYSVRRGEDIEAEDEDEGEDELHKANEFLRSPAFREALRGAALGFTIAIRNRRTPGFRVVGLRRVDARTGGPISIRSALIGALFDQTRQAATKPFLQSRARRGLDRMTELAPRLNEIEQRHRADPQAHARAMMEFYKAEKVKPFAGCGWLLAGPIASQLVFASAIRNGRTAYDRLTGTIVVSNRSRASADRAIELIDREQ